MSKGTLFPLEPERYAIKRWRPISNFSFAARDSTCVLTIQEIANVAGNLPIAFLRGDSGVTPVALMGLRPDQNLCVSAEGEWLAVYLPAVYRCHPFKLVQQDAETSVVCFDEGSGALSENPDDMAFYQEGKLAEDTAKVLEFLSMTARGQAVAMNAATLLDKAGLLTDWKISIVIDNEEKVLNGLLCVDEEALLNLSDESFLTLRESNAITLAYSQLISKQHLGSLKKLAQIQFGAGQRPQEAPKELFELSSDTDTINFDNL